VGEFNLQVFENFTLCDLNNFEVILKKIFLDAWEVDIIHIRSKLRVYTNVSFKLMNLDVKYNFVLAKIGIN
jgi:hypothetical protein